MLCLIDAPIDAKLPPMRHARMDRHVASLLAMTQIWKPIFALRAHFFRQALMLVALTYSAPSNKPPQHSHAHAPFHARPSANSQFPCAWRRCASPPAQTSGPWVGRISFRWRGSKKQALGPWVRLPWCALAGNVRLLQIGQLGQRFLPAQVAHF